MAHRLMRDPAWWSRQRDQRFTEPRVASLNRRIRSMGLACPPCDEGAVEPRIDSEAHPPYIAPHHGGAAAKVLCVYRDPGPGAGGKRGSGFLCWENNDMSAERMAGLASCAGLAPEDICPWNSYPWFINRKPDRGELSKGLQELVWILGELQDCRVVVFFGETAHRLRVLAERDPDWQCISAERDLIAFETFHTSPQAVITDAVGRTQHIFSTLSAAASAIGRSPVPECTCPASSTVPGAAATAPSWVQKKNRGLGHARPVGPALPQPRSLEPSSLAESPPQISTRARGVDAFAALLRAAGWEFAAPTERTRTIAATRAIEEGSAAPHTFKFSTRSGGDWQLRASDGDKPADADSWALIYVPRDGRASVRVYPAPVIVDLIKSKYAEYLRDHGGHRPVNRSSDHFGLRPRYLDGIQEEDLGP